MLQYIMQVTFFNLCSLYILHALFKDPKSNKIFCLFYSVYKLPMIKYVKNIRVHALVYARLQKVDFSSKLKPFIRF